MNDPWVIAGGVILVLILVGRVLFLKRRDGNRVATMQAWARRRGWSFDPKRRRGWENSFPFHALKRGHGAYAHNVMTGELGGRSVRAFDHFLRVGSGDDGGSCWFSGLIVDAGARLRALDVRPESIVDKLKAAVGRSDIQFSSAEFSSRYWVECRDTEWARSVLNPTAIALILDLSRRITIQCLKDRVLFTSGKSRWSEAEFDEAVDFAGRFLALLPGGNV